MNSTQSSTNGSDRSEFQDADPQNALRINVPIEARLNALVDAIRNWDWRTVPVHEVTKPLVEPLFPAGLQSQPPSPQVPSPDQMYQPSRAQQFQAPQPPAQPPVVARQAFDRPPPLGTEFAPGSAGTGQPRHAAPPYIYERSAPEQLPVDAPARAVDPIVPIVENQQQVSAPTEPHRKAGATSSGRLKATLPWIVALVIVVIIIIVIRTIATPPNSDKLPPAKGSHTTTTVLSAPGAINTVPGGSQLSKFARDMNKANLTAAHALTNGGSTLTVSQLDAIVSPYAAAVKVYSYQLHFVVWPPLRKPVSKTSTPS